MRTRVLISLALVIATCLVAPQSGVSARMIAFTIPTCANPALPSIIAPSPYRFEAPPDPRVAAAKLPVISLDAPSAALKLAVASDEASRELGLMCVLRLQPHVGMIFVFDKDSKQEFWMKNTLIPLDMVWVRASGTVDTVAANVPKSTRTTPDDAVARRAGTGKYVIELAAGEAAADGIVVGSDLKMLPAP
jgi:uncharacterized membrane protein (UPF0127 family)